LDEDAALEVVVGTVAGDYAELRAYNHDGSLLWTRQSPQFVYGNLSDAGEASAFDLDEDGKPELINDFLETGNHYQRSRAFTKADGTPFQDNIELGDMYAASLVLGAMEGGAPNVVTRHSRGIQIQRIDGSMVHGSPISTLPTNKQPYQYLQSQLFLSDIDNDGDLEMGIQATDYSDESSDALVIQSEIRVWNHDGTVHPASVKFPIQTVTDSFERQALYGQVVTPVTVDIDGDGRLEIVSFAPDCMLRISDATGNILTTSSYDSSDRTGLACLIGDISSFTTNTDVRISFAGTAFSRGEVEGGGFISQVLVSTNNASAVKNPNNWPNSRHDLARTGAIDLVHLCGNGLVDSGELCDDADRESGDGCSNTCQVESGYTCSGSPSVCKAANSYFLPIVYGTS